MPRKQKEDAEEPSSDVEPNASEEESTEKKAKFVFKCTQCIDADAHARCCVRGNIPLTFWDLELWAKNKVVANMLPHLATDLSPIGLIDLVIKAIPLGTGGTEGKTAEVVGENDPDNPDEHAAEAESEDQEPSDGNEGTRCPLYRVTDRACLIYENRPLYCRMFPLEYDGNTFALSDLDCPGVGVGSMTKEELQQIREDARNGFAELRRMRISLPILNQIISQHSIQTVMEAMFKETEERMKGLSEEDRRKIDEINQKMAGEAGQNEA